MLWWMGHNNKCHNNLDPISVVHNSTLFKETSLGDNNNKEEWIMEDNLIPLVDMEEVMDNNSEELV